MYQQLATRIRQQLDSLVEQYEARLSVIAGYADFPQQARRDLAQQVLSLVAECLDSNDDQALINYIRERARQVLARGFEPEWFQQVVAVVQDIITPLVQTLEESNFAWCTMNHAQTTAWEIVAAERRRIASSLHESELRYQIIFDSTPIMFWLKDAQNRTLRINKAAAELEGVNPADVEGKSAYDLYPHEQAEAFYQDDLEVIQSGKPKLGIVEQHTAVGTNELMWLETGKTPVRNDDGEIVGVLAFAVDITERKRLEQKIQESLDRRERQVQTSTEVAQEIAAAPELNELFQRVVTLIKERFNYYHAQFFRHEAAQGIVVLVSGYGEAGRKMLSAGHQLPLGSGIVGTAAATGRAVLAPDVKLDPDWRPNPNLPKTQGELAVPIKWRDQLLGILDVQSDQAGALTQEDQLLLEGLCGQIASAMESTRLLDNVHQSEQMLRTLIDAIPDYIYAKDLDGRHLLGNAALARLYGLTTSELVGKTDFDLYPRELAEQYRASELPILRKGHMLLAHEEPNVDAAGNLKWNSTTKVPLRNQAGEIIGLVGITSDITQRKQVETDLRKFKLGLDRSTAAVFITDLDNVITYVNAAFVKIYGYTAQEVIGQTPRILKPGSTSSDEYREFWTMLAASAPSANEIINKTKDGRLIVVEGSSTPILNETGEVIGFLGMHMDITERRKVEQRLARSEQLLRTIVDNSPDLIYIKDTDSRFLVSSQAMARLVGVSSADDLLGKNDFDLYPAELASKYYADEQQIMQTGKPLIDIEEPAVQRDGTPIWLLTTKVPFYAADGTLMGLVGLGRDITERKRSEQQMQETLREMERLYASVSREGWQTYRQASELPEGVLYDYDRIALQPITQPPLPAIEQAVQQRQIVTVEAADQAVTAIPLTVRGEIVGALGVYNDPDRPLAHDELALVQAVSEQVALALESARLFDQTQLALAETSALFRFSEFVSRETEVKPIYDQVAQLLIEEASFTGTWIAEVDTQAKALRRIAGAGLGMSADIINDIVPYEQTQTPATLAARERAMVVVNDPLHDERLRDLPDQMKTAAGKAIAVPVLIGGEIASVIAATRPMDEPDINERDQRLMQAVALQVAVAVQRAQLFKQTQEALADTRRRAQREQILREVTARVRSSTDPDTIMRTLARELSAVLDRPTVVRLAVGADQEKVQSAQRGGQPVDEGSK